MIETYIQSGHVHRASFRCVSNRPFAAIQSVDRMSGTITMAKTVWVERMKI